MMSASVGRSLSSDDVQSMSDLKVPTYLNPCKD